MKNDNPLNEVKMLYNSIMNSSGIMLTDKTIKHDVENLVLKYRIGDEIRLNEVDFIHISAVFFAKTENKYL